MIGRRAGSIFVAESWRIGIVLMFLWVLGVASIARAETLGGGAEDDISLWRVGGALLLCLVLGVAAAFALRARTGHPSPLLQMGKRPRRLAIIESLRLGRQVSLSIVACDEKEFLILSSDQTVQFIEHPSSSPKCEALGAEKDP